MGISHTIQYRALLIEALDAVWSTDSAQIHSMGQYLRHSEYCVLMSVPDEVQGQNSRHGQTSLYHL